MSHCGSCLILSSPSSLHNGRYHGLWSRLQHADRSTWTRGGDPRVCWSQVLHLLDFDAQELPGGSYRWSYAPGPVLFMDLFLPQQQTEPKERSSIYHWPNTLMSRHRKRAPWFFPLAVICDFSRGHLEEGAAIFHASTLPTYVRLKPEESRGVGSVHRQKSFFSLQVFVK